MKVAQALTKMSAMRRRTNGCKPAMQRTARQHAVLRPSLTRAWQCSTEELPCITCLWSRPHGNDLGAACQQSSSRGAQQVWRSSILAAKVQSACHCLSLSSACFLPPASCRCAVCPLRGLLRGRHAVAAAAVPHLDAAATALHFAAATLPPLLPTRQPTLHRLHTYPVSTQQPTSRGHCTS